MLLLVMLKNTVRIGTISELKIKSKLLELGLTNLLNPITNDMPYDLALDMGDHLIKIQIKTGRLRNGTVRFCTSSSKSNMTSIKRRSYRGLADYFAIYCPENDGYYLIPVNRSTVTEMMLRIEVPKNSQAKFINWARDFELNKVIKSIG